MATITEVLKLTLQEAQIAKAHRTGKLGAAEIDRLTKDLEVRLRPIIEAEAKTAEAENKWFGIDTINDVEYAAEKKRDVTDSWIDDNGLNKENVKSTRIGQGVYYYIHVTPQVTHILWVANAEHKQEVENMVAKAS